MAYSRWSNSKFYTYGGTVKSGFWIWDNYFDVDCEHVFMYSDINRDLEGCLNKATAHIDDLNEREEAKKELKGYISEWLEDLSKKYFFWFKSPSWLCNFKRQLFKC